MADTYALFEGQNVRLFGVQYPGSLLCPPEFDPAIHELKKFGNSVLLKLDADILSETEELALRALQTENILDLRIQDFLHRPKRRARWILNKTFTTVGLIKDKPEYERGRKAHADYLDGDGNKVVHKVFSDVTEMVEISEGVFVEHIKGINILFEWFKHNGEVGLSKTQYVPLTQEQVAELEETRRRRAIHYLIQGAKNTALQPVIDAVRTVFHSEIEAFKSYGTSDFRQGIEAARDTVGHPLHTYMNLVVFSPYQAYQLADPENNTLSEDDFNALGLPIDPVYVWTSILLKI